MNILIETFLRAYDPNKTPYLRFGYILPEYSKDKDCVEYFYENSKTKKYLHLKIKGQTAEETLGYFLIELSKLKDN